MPTLALQVAANGDDGFVDSYLEVFSSSSNPAVGRNFAPNYSAWFRFAGFSLPHGSVISSAVLELYGYSATLGSPQTRIVAQKNASAPAAPTNYADFWARTRTSAAVAWNAGTLSTSAWTSLPDCASVIAEIVAANTLTAILLFLENTSGASAQDVHYIRGLDAYAEAAKLTITYTTPALLDPRFRKTARGPNVRAR